MSHNITVRHSSPELNNSTFQEIPVAAFHGPNVSQELQQLDILKSLPYSKVVRGKPIAV